MAHIGIIKFQLAGIHFGMDAERILEIVRLSQIRSIPRPLPYVLGLMKLRNYIITVVDFRRRLGLSSLPNLQGATVIVARIASHMLGLLVENISEFRQIPEDHILPPISVAGFPEQLLQGVIAEKDDILLVPDLDTIFSSFIKVQLLPITAAEKIAFQYRFTPGSLIRTLENTLAQQHFLNKKLVNKLPRSMCFSSVVVHKIISYYTDFSPGEEDSGQESRQAETAHKTKAGDEKYLSLSEQLRINREFREHQEADLETTVNTSDEKRMFTPNARISPAKNLETLLHHLHLSGEQSHEKPPRLPEVIVSQYRLAAQFAKTLRMSPISLTKYVSYYTYSDSGGDHIHLSKGGVGSAKVTLENRLQELLDTSQRIDELLQTLSDEQYVLTRRHIQWIANHYHMPLVKIAKKFLNFPGLSYELGIEQEDMLAETANREELPEWNKTHKPVLSPSTSLRIDSVEGRNAAFSELFQALHISRKISVSECLYRLAQADKLSENQVIRAVASHLHIPTCRLSKLRSYYRYEHTLR